jgi:hypothetical protein
VGLEDAGELVGLATTEQLVDVLDEDLWRSSGPGQDPSFDSERFLLWLEVLSESGDRFLAARLAELPPDLLTLALHRHVLVVPLDDLRAELESGDDEAEAAEKALSDCLGEELDDYQLLWRGGEGWDTVLSALLALDQEHHDVTVSLLERCAAASREHLEDNGGLYEVLTSDEMLESDLSGEREGRRVEQGFVAPSAAAGFLRLALRHPNETPATEHDPLTRGYFREVSRRPVQSAPTAPRKSALGGLLTGAPSESDVGLAPLPDEPRREPLVIRALQVLSETAPSLFTQRSEELAYLSNVLVAGATVNGRPIRPVDAVEQAIACVSVGLAFAVGVRTPSPERAAEVLATHPCDGLFRLAFARARETSPRDVDPEALERVQALLKTLKV